MPRYIFKCDKGHYSELKFATMSDGAEFLGTIAAFKMHPPCPVEVDHENGEMCWEPAKQVLTAPTLHFLGSGWTDPVPSGRVYTKGEDPTKAAKDLAQEMGPKNWVNAVKQGS